MMQLTGVYTHACVLSYSEHWFSAISPVQTFHNIGPRQKKTPQGTTFRSGRRPSLGG